MSATLRAIPAVEKLLQALGAIDLPRPALVSIVRREVAALRAAKEIPAFDVVVASIRGTIDKLRAQRIQPVLNGTGIVIHTNLGRSPLSPQVIQTLQTIGANYNNLEFDLVAGERGPRAGYLEHNLALLCGAEVGSPGTELEFAL